MVRPEEAVECSCDGYDCGPGVDRILLYEGLGGGWVHMVVISGVGGVMFSCPYQNGLSRFWVDQYIQPLPQY